MKMVLTMRLPKPKVYFFLVALSTGTLIFYISYQSMSAENISIRVKHPRNQKPGFPNQILASIRQSADRTFNGHLINISYDALTSEVQPKNSNSIPRNPEIKIIKSANSFDGRGLTDSDEMSGYERGLNSGPREDPMSWQEKRYGATSIEENSLISSVEKTEQILNKEEMLKSGGVETGLSGLTMIEYRESGMRNGVDSGMRNGVDSGMRNGVDSFVRNAQSPSTSYGLLETSQQNSRLSESSNSLKNSSAAPKIAKPKSPNSLDLALPMPTSSKPNNKKVKFNLPFQLQKNLKTNRIIDKYKNSPKRRYLSETNITQYPLDKSERLIYMNNFVKMDIIERYRNMTNTSFDALRHFYSSNKNYGTTLPMDSTMRPNACNDCFNQNFLYYFNPKAVCNPTSRNVEILLLISSTPKNFAARNVIRETWGSLCHNTNLGCVFLLGINDGLNIDITNAINSEHERYHDLLVANFTDSYANLTYKTMMGLKWAVDNCGLVQFIMKTDDDMYVNTELLPVILKDAKPLKFMGGFCWAESSPHRNKNSKWYVSYQMYSNARFPPMCSGTGYVMSKDTAEQIVKVSRNIPFFYLEDVYVALCLNRLTVSPKRLRGFHNVFVKFDPCAYRHSIITSHEIRPDDLALVWKSSRNCPTSKPHINYQELPYF